MRLDILLKSKTLEVVKINKKTSAHLFKDLEVGSKIVLSIPVERVGVSRGRTYAPAIRVKNIETGEATFKTFNEMPHVLKCFEFKEGESQNE